MPAQAKTVVHLYKSKLAQSQFDFYVQAIDDTYIVKVDGQERTDWQPQGTFNGNGWRIGFPEPIAAETEVSVQFDARDFMPEPEPQPEPTPDPEPAPAPQPTPDPDPAPEPEPEPTPDPASDDKPAEQPTQS